MKVHGKTIVVTGGGSGLGRELVLELLRRGAKVATADINESKLEETKQLAGENAQRLSTYVLDISNQEQVASLPEQVTSVHGSVDGVINNAGIIQPFLKVNDLPLEKAIKVMQVNYFGQLYMIKAFLPLLLERPEAHIVNVSSMGGFFPVPGQTIYGASKAAVKLLTEGLLAELRKTNVKVMVAIPGSMGTNIMQNSGVKMNAEMEKMQGNVKVLSPQKAARIVLNGMERNRSRVFVGMDARMMDILYRLFPTFAPKVFAKLLGDKLIQD